MENDRRSILRRSYNKTNRILIGRGEESNPIKIDRNNKHANDLRFAFYSDPSELDLSIIDLNTGNRPETWVGSKKKSNGNIDLTGHANDRIIFDTYDYYFPKNITGMIKAYVSSAETISNVYLSAPYSPYANPFTAYALNYNANTSGGRLISAIAVGVTRSLITLTSLPADNTYWLQLGTDTSVSGDLTYDTNQKLYITNLTLLGSSAFRGSSISNAFIWGHAKSLDQIVDFIKNPNQMIMPA